MRHSTLILGVIALALVACSEDRAPGTSPAPITALLNLPPLASAGGPYSGTGTVRFDGSGSLDPDGSAKSLRYRWDFGDGNTGSGRTPTHTYARDGAYVVTLTVLDSAGASSAPAATSATITGSAGAPVVLTGAGNIARCANGRAEGTAVVLDGRTGWVAALGDNAFPNGRTVDYNACYEPTWGRHRSRTFPVLGNHEYDMGNADGAFTYFGARLPPPGYYSVDVGDWHIIVLNDNATYAPYAAGSAQDQWLVQDLAANTKRCTLAMWHVPLFLSSNTAGYTVNPSRRTLWQRLHAAGADVVLNGGQHHYERMAPMRPDGTRDDANGMRQFNVGTGGESVIMPTVAIHPNSDVRAIDFGVLSLTLRADGYDWEFLPSAGGPFRDTGSGTCR